MTRWLALHGFTGSPAAFARTLEFAEIGALAPALVGHAGAERDAHVDRFELELERLAGLACAEGPLHVVGYSLGARLALALTLRHPELVRTLTLISGHPGLANAAERLARRSADQHWIELLEEHGLPGFVDAWEQQPLWASQQSLAAELLVEKRRERLSHTAAGLARCLRAVGLAEMPDHTPELGRIAVPTTVLAGALDTKFVALARAMSAGIRGSELCIVPGAGHDLLLEEPGAVARALRAAAARH